MVSVIEPNVGLEVFAVAPTGGFTVVTGTGTVADATGSGPAEAVGAADGASGGTALTSAIGAADGGAGVTSGSDVESTSDTGSAAVVEFWLTSGPDMSGPDRCGPDTEA